ncbi:dCMP deaminase [Mobilisporobacter senegalensis]|uniref:dCMP deaminase n=1 Tax=Mobilisporobacter senegalensis TaxID=1329262 RepID=A0A3N1XMJ7_9FIRM|nr:dCMP deaminase family protein [Mobilisporobacter senegalensis]ROR26312.1 dCMP deaminase [Mobilisporobacter senegalensis]
MKKQNYLKWDEYFMGIALLSAERSKDPNTSVGACIVSEDNKILSLGYNGMPIGCSDDEYPWEREGDPLDTKYLYVCHAEMNAILNYTGTNMRNSKVYVTLFPCNECSKALIQKGIKEIIYMEDKYADQDSVKASKRMLDSAGVKYRMYQPIHKTITLSL